MAPAAHREGHKAPGGSGVRVKVVQAPVDLKVAIMAPVAVVMSVVRACHLLRPSTTMVIRSQALEQWGVCRTTEVIRLVDCQAKALSVGLAASRPKGGLMVRWGWARRAGPTPGEGWRGKWDIE